MSYQIINHGSAKSGYDRQVRAIVSQFQNADCTLYTLQRNIQEDISKIKRANTAVASNCYAVVIKDEYEAAARLEIWNNVIPGKERLTVTLKKSTAPTHGL